MQYAVVGTSPGGIGGAIGGGMTAMNVGELSGNIDGNGMGVNSNMAGVNIPAIGSNMGEGFSTSPIQEGISGGGSGGGGGGGSGAGSYERMVREPAAMGDPLAPNNLLQDPLPEQVPGAEAPYLLGEV